MTDEVAPPKIPMSPIPRILAGIGAALLTLASIAWALQFYRNVLGLLLFNEQYLAGMLGVGLMLVYLTLPFRRGTPRAHVPWYDWLLSALSLLSVGYLAVKFPTLSEEVTARPLDGLLVAFVVIVLVMEGLRRTTGWALVIVVAAFLGYALIGDLIPGQLAGRPVKVTQLAYYVVWDPGSMLGTPVLVACTIVIAFIFFGQLLFASGGSAFFTDISLAVMGRYRGGSAKIAVTASGLFGMISGSAVSNVTSTGVITIPLMRKGGYPPHVAGAIEAVSSTGGQLMPPVMGAAAFLMAEFLQVPYREVVIAAALPALLYYFALFVQADLLAARTGIARVEESRIPQVAAVLARGWHFLLPFAMLIVGLFWLNWSAERSALAGAAVLMATGSTLGYGDQRLTLRSLLSALRDTGIATLDLLMITAAAGFIIGVINVSGLGFSLTLALVQIGGESAFLLLTLSAIVCIVLGMGMPTVGVYVLLATLVAPALVKVGVSPMAAHMFVMYFGMMSMITPPVALAAYAAASLAQTDAMKTGWAAVRFGWVAYVIPFLFVRAPSLLLEGTFGSVVLALLTAFAGVWMVSAAFAGYCTRPLNMPMRVGFGVAGLLMFIPADWMHYGIVTDFVGLVLGAILIGREVFATRLQRRTA
ncbi:MAG TPA: TRAP transporter fused permease subunit [Xanthobacteraceae bacterium]|nr:TRAP transporter fused permease subunit [Xanthobacteraceae bacterium]